jgi:inosose dehydratase
LHLGPETGDRSQEGTGRGRRGQKAGAPNAREPGLCLIVCRRRRQAPYALGTEVTQIALRFAHQTLLWVSAHGPENLPQTLKEVAEAGFPGVEICEPLEATGGPDQFQFMLDDNNLELASISCGFGTDLKDKEKLQEIQARIDFASRFAVDSVMLCGGWYDRGTKKEDSAFRELANASENVAFYAEKHNMRIAFHNHVGSLVETIDDVERLLGMSKSIGVCVDTAHFAAVGTDPIAVVERFPDRVIYCHLKDWDSRVAKLQDDNYWKGFVELGAGNAGIDFGRFLDTIESRTKTQWVAVELDKTTNSSCAWVGFLPERGTRTAVPPAHPGRGGIRGIPRSIEGSALNHPPKGRHKAQATIGLQPPTSASARPPCQGTSSWGPMRPSAGNVSPRAS